jgi:hypothetical protein
MLRLVLGEPASASAPRRAVIEGLCGRGHTVRRRCHQIRMIPFPAADIDTVNKPENDHPSWRADDGAFLTVTLPATIVTVPRL